MSSVSQQTEYLEDTLMIYVHTVIRLYTLLAEIDGSACPMHVIMIDGY